MSDDQTTTDQTDERDAGVDDQSTDQTTTTSSDLGDKGAAAIKAERDARRKAERDLKALQAKVAEFENKDKTETERSQAAQKAAEERATAAENRLRAANARVAITEAAQKANATSTRLVMALITPDLEYDDNGEPTNINALIAQAKKDEPSLFRAAQGSGDGGKGQDKAPKTDINAALRHLAGRTS